MPYQTMGSIKSCQTFASIVLCDRNPTQRLPSNLGPGFCQNALHALPRHAMFGASLVNTLAKGLPSDLRPKLANTFVKLNYSMSCSGQRLANRRLGQAMPRPWPRSCLIRATQFLPRFSRGVLTQSCLQCGEVWPWLAMPRPLAVGPSASERHGCSAGSLLRIWFARSTTRPSLKASAPVCGHSRCSLQNMPNPSP